MWDHSLHLPENSCSDSHYQVAAGPTADAAGAALPHPDVIDGVHRRRDRESVATPDAVVTITREPPRPDAADASTQVRVAHDPPSSR